MLLVVVFSDDQGRLLGRWRSEFTLTHEDLVVVVSIWWINVIWVVLAEKPYRLIGPT